MIYYYFILNLLLDVNVYCVQDVLKSYSATKHFIYNKYKYDTIINLAVNSSTEQILEFEEASEEWSGYPTRVHVNCNININQEYPVFIIATQQKGVSSWELPLIVQTSHSTMQFNSMGRTLCPHDDTGTNITTKVSPMIQLGTSNPNNVSLNIKLRRVHDFYVEVNKEIHLNVTPGAPKYYYFSFYQEPWNSTQYHLHYLLPKFNYTIPKNVILIIESEDDDCAIVSIQNNSCPVFDNERDILYQGYHLTMSTKGGITLTQSMFPDGFYIMFIVKENNEDCTGLSEVVKEYTNTTRLKRFRFRIIATISYKEYVIGASVLFGIVLLTYALASILTYCHCNWTEEVTVREEMPGTSSVQEEPGPSEVVPIISRSTVSEVSSDFESECVEAMPSNWTVAELNRLKPDSLSRRSDRYFWSALTMAVVYALPVVQLLFTYQRMVFQTGDQDLCYYNFLCAHPLGFLSDFNHVYSNIGYVILGLLFMVQIRAKNSTTNERHMGIPQHRGLFYSMGLALAMEGVLSACYHLCPNKMNFQFDSSFMYVIAVLCMVKLYQNRHPDVNASAHATFMLLAVVMAVGVIGIMYTSVGFWIFFTIVHLFTCFILTLKIYYVGRFKLERSVGGRAWRLVRESGCAALVPQYRARAALLALANLANWGLAARGMYEHNMDFARHLLAILISNTILYTMFYVIMKLIHREKIMIYTWLYFIFAHIAWFSAYKFFSDSRTKWSETPADSRRHNAICSALQMYDSHDLWHLLSAAALFLCFNLLLTLDDGLVNTPTSDIPVF